MIIKKIKGIKNLGSFSDFQWVSTCNDFKQYNFFYGWNYSGKTTLSRIFKCLEDKKTHPDFPNLQFKLETDNGDITEENIGQDYKIRVFNDEFIEENFKWDDENHEIAPILILGKKSIELENQLKELTEQLDKKKIEKKETEKNSERNKSKIEKSLTEEASYIRDILTITNPKEFDKNNLSEKINSIRENYEQLLLSEKDLQNEKNTFTTDQKETIKFLTFPLDVDKYLQSAKEILGTQISVHKVIEKFKENTKLSKWVREGIALHENETICQFCGNKLSKDRLDELNQHFSQEYDNLSSKIKEKEEQLTNRINEIEKHSFPNKAILFKELQQDYEKNLNEFNNVKNKYISVLNSILSELNRKKEKPFENLELSPNTKETANEVENKLNICFKKLEDIKRKHNNKVNDLEQLKYQAKEKIINHYIAEFIKKEDYFNKLKEINDTQEQIDILGEKIREISDKIRNIEKEINSSAKGAEKINEYLQRFFNDDKLKFELTEDSKYKLSRDGDIAKNLSTGEKNIISLIYFFTRLEENNFDLSQAIIFIDDPVSSLDNNHTFQVYGFLNEKLKNCGQLFITTHNFNFFNLLKDLIKGDLQGISNRRSKVDKENYYLIKKIMNSEKIKQSKIVILPEVLQKFKGEYNYLFKILKDFSDTKDFEFLYIMPNIARRFLECYLFMRYPDGKNYKDKCKKFFEGEDASKVESLLKLLDEYSHEQSPDHSQYFPDVNEVEKDVKFLLETIEKNDEPHYNALCNS